VTRISFWPAPVPPAWLAAGFAVFFLPPYWALARLEPYASRTAEETSFDVFLVRMMSMLVPYIVWVFFRGLARIQQALQALRPALALSEEEIADVSRSLASVEWRQLIAILAFALPMVAYFQERGAARFTQMLESPSAADFWLLVCGMASWTSVLLAVWVAVRSANALRRLAAHVEQLDPFDLDPIRPFGRFGLRMALYLVGGIAIFESSHVFAPAGIRGVGILLGVVSAIPAVAIFLLPTWGIHQRQRQQKRNLLREVDSQLASHKERNEETLRPFLDLLEYRDRVRRASEWPFEISTVLRLALYTVIPLASWVAAALVERLLDRFLS
jgi:hypothetical protein